MSIGSSRLEMVAPSIGAESNKPKQNHIITTQSPDCQQRYYSAYWRNNQISEHISYRKRQCHTGSMGLKMDFMDLYPPP